MGTPIYLPLTFTVLSYISLAHVGNHPVTIPL